MQLLHQDFYCSKNSDKGSKPETVEDLLRNLYSCYAASDVSPQPERAVEPTTRCFMYMFKDELEEEERRRRSLMVMGTLLSFKSISSLKDVQEVL
ncbi:hypothetical protein Bca101_060560 [Brassica carinata]